MTYGPPPEPNTYPAPTPPHPHPQQPWTDPHGRAWPGGPPPVATPKGFGPAVFAVVLGLLGCAVPLLPINLDLIRGYSPFPFGLPGLVLAVVGCTGRRRGKPVAVAGAILSVLALVLGVYMVAGIA
jgi:hypothetical protein